jgi:hypothetical protein
MPRYLFGLFALAAIAAAIALAIARPGALSNQGSFAQPAAAVADAEPTLTPWAYIDKVNNGEGWCDPERIDDQTTEYVGDSHQLAVCMDNLPAPVHAFYLAINYDGTLDRCIEEECIPTEVGLSAQRTLVDGEGCLDDNPDANAGDTIWGDGLGDGWNCSYLNGEGLAAAEIILRGPEEPVCDAPDHAVGHRTALISCYGPGELTAATNGSSYTLGDDETWGALAVLDLSVIGVGTDNVEIEYLDVDGADGTIGYCSNIEEFSVAFPAQEEMPCVGATDIKKQQRRSTPTPTDEPTATATSVPPTAAPTVPPPPPPTATPFGGAGPLVVPPVTGSGPTTGSAPWAIWLAAGIVGAATATGGLYLRRKTR